ncbi:MAG TPA: DinB family protein [Acidimicrobiales bacterium]
MTNNDASSFDIPTERRFGWSNLFVAPDEDPRNQSTLVGERATLIDFRLTLELKCQGLSAEQMARRTVPPSNMSLLGLVRHMADVERYWFRQVLSGEEVSPRYRTSDDHDADFDGAIADPAVVNDAWNVWREEVTYAEHFFDSIEDYETTVPLPNEDQVIAVREVLIHMIAEYARHCGHADLLRERIDGRVGF